MHFCTNSALSYKPGDVSWAFAFFWPIFSIFFSIRNPHIAPLLTSHNYFFCCLRNDVGRISKSADMDLERQVLSGDVSSNCQRFLRAAGVARATEKSCKRKKRMGGKRNVESNNPLLLLQHTRSLVKEQEMLIRSPGFPHCLFNPMLLPFWSCTGAI